MLKQIIITEAMREVGRETKRKNIALKAGMKIPRPCKAIRLKCLECTCGSSHEVSLCHLSDCPLFPFRFGRNPKPADLKVPVFDNWGEKIGERDYEGFTGGLSGS